MTSCSLSSALFSDCTLLLSICTVSFLYKLPMLFDQLFKFTPCPRLDHGVPLALQVCVNNVFSTLFEIKENTLCSKLRRIHDFSTFCFQVKLCLTYNQNNFMSVLSIFSRRLKISKFFNFKQL